MKNYNSSLRYIQFYSLRYCCASNKQHRYRQFKSAKGGKVKLPHPFVHCIEVVVVVITWFNNQRNYFENAMHCSKRHAATDKAHLNLRIGLVYLMQ